MTPMSDPEPLRETVELSKRRVSHSRNLLQLIDGLLRSSEKKPRQKDATARKDGGRDWGEN